MEIRVAQSTGIASQNTDLSIARGAHEAPRLMATWARHEEEVRQAQRLRYQVFAQELGASLASHPGLPTDLDIDQFDSHCEHLIVRTLETDNTPSEVVGTYRVLTPAGAIQAGRLYSDGEFELAALDPYRHELAEIGRAHV